MNIEGSRVLITGGAGFIGSFLAEALSETCDVLIMDNLSSGKKGSLIISDFSLDGARRSALRIGQAGQKGEHGK